MIYYLRMLSEAFMGLSRIVCVAIPQQPSIKSSGAFTNYHSNLQVLCNVYV